MYDRKTNVEKCVEMSRISNKCVVIDVEVLELLFSDSSLQSLQCTVHHYSATDENAAIAHGKCPLGAKSWCKCQAAVAQGVKPPKHPNFLGPEAVKLVRGF